ncbi:glycosyltransferase family 2 protein [Puniceicoccaceae bacterium]|nr:glycosyltransferase family 2 protein [Puniceicoccaceae bacterium]
MREGKSESGVGVVIPVYNRPNTIVETLGYVFAQTVQPTRLVVVDDGSTDNTADHVESWLQQMDPKFEWMVLRNAKSTAADARNSGFEHVRHLPYVTFLDSDDHWPCDFIERTSGLLELHHDLVAVMTDMECPSTASEVVEPKRGAGMASDPILWLFVHGAAIASCTMLRTEACIAAGGWPRGQQSSEDMILFTRVALCGPWGFAAGAPVIYHFGQPKHHNEEGNLSRSNKNAELYWCRNLEDMFQLVCAERPSIKQRPLRRIVGDRWRQAGRFQRSNGNYECAKQCFAYSIRWAPFSYDSWRRWFKMCRKTKTFFKARKPVAMSLVDTQPR